MTDAEAIYRFRVAVLEYAESTGNVAATCRIFQVSRKSFYKWRERAGPLRPGSRDRGSAQRVPRSRENGLREETWALLQDSCASPCHTPIRRIT